MRYSILFLALLLAGCMSDKDKRNGFFLQGNQALERGAFKEAIEHYTNALTVDPAFADALNNRGVALMERGNAYDAILDYNQALIIDPEHDECRINRAYAFEYIGQFDNALGDVNYLLKKSQDSAFLHFYKGLVLTKTRDYRGALDAFNQSITLGMDQTETFVNVATIHYFIGTNDSARYYLDRVFAENPKEPNALNTLSQLRLTEGDFTGALYAIEQALEVVPKEPFFLNNRGLIYLEMGLLDRGLEDINQSILLNPENGWAYRNKGIYHYRKAEYDRAIELFQRALDTREFIDEIHYYFGLALQANGNLAAACGQWKIGKEKGEKRSIDKHFGC